MGEDIGVVLSHSYITSFGFEPPPSIPSYEFAAISAALVERPQR